MNANEAKLELLSSDESYSQSEARKKVIEHLDRYLDPDEARAPRLVGYVRELRDLLSQWDTSNLLLKVASVHQKLNALSSAIAEKAILPGAINPMDDPTENLVSVMESNRDWQRKMEEYNSKLKKLHLDDTVAYAFEIGSDVIKLRQSVIDQFAWEHLDVTIEDYVEAVRQTYRKKLIDGISDKCNALIELLQNQEIQSAFFEELLGAAVPLGKIVFAAKDVRNKAKEIADSFVPKGPIDELFNFWDDLEITQRTIDKQLELLDEQASILNQLIEPL